MITMRIMQNGKKPSLRAVVHIRRRTTTDSGGPAVRNPPLRSSFLWL